MKKKSESAGQTKSRFTEATLETSTNKESKVQNSKVMDRSKRGRAIKEAIFAMQQIDFHLRRLLNEGPKKIGDNDVNLYFPDVQDAPRQIWGHKLIQLGNFVRDEIFAITMEYEDAMFFPIESKEKEK